jgi:inorganic pyrophosphatase
MDVSKIPTGRAPPGDIFVVVEIPQGSAVKYEVDKESGAIFVDRIHRLTASFPARSPRMATLPMHWC